jgi:hypothetical protein
VPNPPKRLSLKRPANRLILNKTSVDASKAAAALHQKLREHDHNYMSRTEAITRNIKRRRTSNNESSGHSHCTTSYSTTSSNLRNEQKAATVSQTYPMGLSNLQNNDNVATPGQTYPAALSDLSDKENCATCGPIYPTTSSNLPNKQSAATAFPKHPTVVLNTVGKKCVEPCTATSTLITNNLQLPSTASVIDSPDGLDSQNSLNTGSASIASTDSHVVRRLRNQVRRLRIRLANERKRTANVTMNLKRFLNADQIKSLQLRSKKSARWSNETVKKSLQIRCATGTLGYIHLLKQGFPLPSYRTLCDRVEAAQFRPGLQRDVIEWLQLQLGAQPPMNRDCVLALDEMAIRPAIEYDRGKLANFYIDIVIIVIISLLLLFIYCYN